MKKMLIKILLLVQPLPQPLRYFQETESDGDNLYRKTRQQLRQKVEIEFASKSISIGIELEVDLRCFVLIHIHLLNKNKHINDHGHLV